MLGAYPTKHLKTPYIITLALINRLYGEEDATQFKESWLSLIHQVTQTWSFFNSASILSSSMAQAISRAKHITLGISLAFYMFYLLETACVVKGMVWKWWPNERQIYVYFQNLWEHQFRIHYIKICKHFVAPMYKLIFC